MASSDHARERRALLNLRLAMIKRCYDSTYKQYADYGGRGITVCERWLNSPSAFVDDVSPRPLGMTMERVDNNKGYCPENFKWVSRAEQVRNRRNSIDVIYQGSKMNLKDACIAAGLPYDPVHKRIKKRGWSVERALSTPVSRNNPRKHLPELNNRTI